MSDVIRPGGGVYPSAEQKYVDEDVGKHQSFMLGIILVVNPSDDKDNLLARSDQQSRGIHHECTVLAGTDLYHPDIFFQHVVLPPMRHSGMDNFEEDLPRGCSQLIDGSTWNGNQNVDYNKLDGEWCLLGFLNGSQQWPFIVAWWPHPADRFNPATSGQAFDRQSLVQADPIKNRFRSIRVINGVMTLVNREGSIYLDTSQGGRSINTKDGKYGITKYDKGGHVQIDVKKTAQLEINFNEKSEKGPRIGAGSEDDSPIHDPDLPHPDQPVVGTTPEPRETTRTYLRGTAYHLKIKTSGLELVCEDTSSAGGETGVINTSVPVNLGADKAQQPAMLGNLFVTPFNQVLTQWNALNGKLSALMTALATLMNALAAMFPPATPVATATTQVATEITTLTTNITTLISDGVPAASDSGPGYLSPNVKLR